MVNPLDGEVFTLYNLKPEKLGLVDKVDRNSTDSDLRQRTYNGFEFGLNGRLRGASFFGGWTAARTINVECDNISDPNTFRFCDQRELDMPWRHDLKVAGSYVLPFDIQLNAAFQSDAGNELRVDWTMTRATRYPANCPGPWQPNALVARNLTVAQLLVSRGATLDAWNPTAISPRLIAPGTKYLERHNQLDLGVRKLFRTGRYQWSGQADVFNATNSGRINAETQTFGPSLGRPTAILQPRTLRLAAQLRCRWCQAAVRRRAIRDIDSTNGPALHCGGRARFVARHSAPPNVVIASWALDGRYVLRKIRGDVKRNQTVSGAAASVRSAARSRDAFMFGSLSLSGSLARGPPRRR